MKLEALGGGTGRDVIATSYLHLKSSAMMTQMRCGTLCNVLFYGVPQPDLRASDVRARDLFFSPAFDLCVFYRLIDWLFLWGEVGEWLFWLESSASLTRGIINQINPVYLQG